MADADRIPGISISTYMIGDATVVQDTEIAGQFARRTIDVAAQQLDDRIRQALIRLGWTPPDGAMELVMDARRWREVRRRACKDGGNIVIELAGAYDRFGLGDDALDAAIDAVCGAEG